MFNQFIKTYNLKADYKMTGFLFVLAVQANFRNINWTKNYKKKQTYRVGQKFLDTVKIKWLLQQKSDLNKSLPLTILNLIV